jgi:hypothetical protein
MRCLVTAGKHIRNIRTIARQPPITEIKGLMEGAFSFESAQRLYSEDRRPAASIAILDKAKPDIESIRGLNLAAVMHTSVQVTRLPF